MCIEFQGKQHYEDVPYWYHTEDEGIQHLELVQKRDKLKQQYCIANNIDLLIIPYWDFEKIPNILKQQLKISTTVTTAGS